MQLELFCSDVEDMITSENKTNEHDQIMRSSS
jgi:hypothetical protein